MYVLTVIDIMHEHTMYKEYHSIQFVVLRYDNASHSQVQLYITLAVGDLFNNRTMIVHVRCRQLLYQHEIL